MLSSSLCASQHYLQDWKSQSLAVFPTTTLNYELHTATRKDLFHWLSIAKYWTLQKEHIRNNQEVWMMQSGSQDTVLCVFTRLPESPAGMGTVPHNQPFHVYWFCKTLETPANNIFPALVCSKEVTRAMHSGFENISWRSLLWLCVYVSENTSCY